MFIFISMCTCRGLADLADLAHMRALYSDANVPNYPAWWWLAKCSPHPPLLEARIRYQADNPGAAW